MSLNGLKQFSDNINTLMDTDAWKDADFGARCNMGYRLLNSKYGVGLFGRVSPFRPKTRRKK